MFCEKCGKKVSHKKSQCDYCKHPIKYEGFSKFEHELVSKPEAAASVAPKVESVSPTVSQPKGPGKLIAIVCAAVALVIIATTALVVYLLSDRQETTPAITPAETEENYEILIAADATLKVKFNSEDAPKYT